MSSSSSQKAFSLIEIIIVISLTSIILFAVSQLLSKTLDSLRFLQEKSQTSESATLGCERLASELAEAVKIYIPIPPEEVKFEKISPNYPEVINITPPLPNSPVDPATWPRAYPLNSYLQITYKVDVNSNLKRTANNHPQTIATNVNSFVVKAHPNGGSGSFIISLSIQEMRRIVTFETVVTVPTLQEHI